MSTGREIRSYDYVNRPYERVRDALRQNALTVFHSATKAAASRAQSIAAMKRFLDGNKGTVQEMFLFPCIDKQRRFHVTTEKCLPETRLAI